MTYKNQLVKKGFTFFVLIACSLLFVVFNSCNNDANESTNTTTAATDTTGAKAKADTTIAPLATVNFPNYLINASDLPVVSGGVGNLVPRKFLLKFQFANVSDPLNTMNLLVYPAESHNHYGQLTPPIQFPPAGFTSISGLTNLVLGNNEIATINLVQPPPDHHTYYFHYLKLIPRVVTNAYDGRRHLVFIIKAYNANDVEITVKGTNPFAIPDSNPCPPNQPTQP